MPALPPESIIRASRRWLHLLRTSTVAQGWALLRADSSYADLTPTQYAEALDWLQSIGFLQETAGQSTAVAAISALPEHQLHQLLLARALEASRPPWLPDADALVPDSSELPQDAASLAAKLGLSEEDALAAIRQAHGRVDLEGRAAVGEAGERALVGLLEDRWPGSTTHVALTDDGFGYDLVLLIEGEEWHLEVKSTTRRGRLVVHLSRHEHEVSLTDPNWRLVVVGLGEDFSPLALATIDHLALSRRAPTDVHSASTWQSARHQVFPADLQPGLTFLARRHLRGELEATALLSSGVKPGATFAWMPATR